LSDTIRDVPNLIRTVELGWIIGTLSPLAALMFNRPIWRLSRKAGAMDESFDRLLE
jgi:hypothetical protein